LPGLDDIGKVHVSASLPALFAHRQPSRGRPTTLAGGTQPPSDTLDAAPIVLFAPRADGKVDRLEVFAPPLPLSSGEHWGIFMARGVTQVPGAADLLEALETHETVLLKAEPRNPYNPRAVLILRADQTPLGYLPDYLANELAAAGGAPERLRVHISRVLRVTFPPAPAVYQVFCRYACPSELGSALFRSSDYEPLIAG
jgi:hypothetical protein